MQGQLGPGMSLCLSKKSPSKDHSLSVAVLVLLLFLTFYFYFCVSTGQYLNLDKDHNGMLSKEELSRYGTATLTSVFLDRVFQECLTYDGEMVQSKEQQIPFFQNSYSGFSLTAHLPVNVQLQTHS